MIGDRQLSPEEARYREEASPTIRAFSLMAKPHGLSVRGPDLPVLWFGHELGSP